MPVPSEMMNTQQLRKPKQIGEQPQADWRLKLKTKLQKLKIVLFNLGPPLLKIQIQSNL
jgi:hypothetical protein